MKSWDDLALATPSEVLSWANSQPWAKEMAECQQDAGWHAEGDVWTHTQMVFRELEGLDDWPNFSQEARLILLFTALFHDAGKPRTTRLDPDTKRVRSPKHAAIGASIARTVLRELSCDLITREEICRLVLFHGRPPYLIEKEDPAQEVIRLSSLVSNRLLFNFAVADTRGRLSSEMSKPEENVHLWKLVAEEKGCLDAPYSFINEQARFLFYRDSLSSLYYTPPMKRRCEVTMMSGLPGAGKDTWLSRHANHLPMVSLDDLREELNVSAGDNQGRVIQAARERVREFLRAGSDFAFNATNLTRQTRGRWIDLFANYDARVRIVYIEPPISVIHRNNNQREEPVPQKVMDSLQERLEPPTIAEAHEVSFIGCHSQTKG